MERYNIYIVILCIFAVTSLAEVWIEIYRSDREDHMPYVTSLAEVWIEIKFVTAWMAESFVTSLAEVWIEMPSGMAALWMISGHFPCGSVD